MKCSTRSTLSLAALAWPVLLATSLGCDESTPVSKAEGASVPIEEFSAQYSQAFCAQNFRCSSAGDIGGRTMQECVEETASGLDLLTMLISESQDKARISYDGERMVTCITAVKQLTCDDWKKGVTLWTNQPGACRAAIVPKVALGGACQEDIECTTGLCADADSSATPPVDGKCTKLLSFGDSCASGISCADDLYCDEASRQCLARKPAGRSCISDEECMTTCNVVTGTCSAYAGCAVGGASPKPELLWLAAVGGAMLLGLRRPRRL
jgi:MYXO-CTERM domain-containing protein